MIVFFAKDLYICACARPCVLVFHFSFFWAFRISHLWSEVGVWGVGRGKREILTMTNSLLISPALSRLSSFFP